MNVNNSNNLLKEQGNINERVESLIEALRNELQQYGEMLAILERHQNNILDSDASKILDDLSSITAQNDTIKNSRFATEKAKQNLCVALGLSDNSSFQETISRLPYEYQLLMNALIDENNSLITRIESRARQNHLLLKRSIDIIQQIISELVPGLSAKTYTSNGFVIQSNPTYSSLYSEIG